MKNKHKTEALKPSLIFSTSGDIKGEINLFWEPVKDANTYVIQRSSVKKERLRWQHVDIIDKSNYTDTGLKSGTRYCFRVAAVSKQGQGPWSEPVFKKAP